MNDRENKLMNDLGELEIAEYLAVKSLEKRMLHADVEKLYRMGEDGRFKEAEPQEIEAGDTIRVSATIGNMSGGPTKTGGLTIRDINDAFFDARTGELVIDANEFCLSTINCNQEMAILKEVIEQENWVTKEDLIEMTHDVSVSKFMELEHERVIGKTGYQSNELSLNDFFDESYKTYEDRETGGNNFSEPELMF